MENPNMRTEEYVPDYSGFIVVRLKTTAEEPDTETLWQTNVTNVLDRYGIAKGASQRLIDTDPAKLYTLERVYFPDLQRPVAVPRLPDSVNIDSFIEQQGLDDLTADPYSKVTTDANTVMGAFMEDTSWGGRILVEQNVRFTDRPVVQRAFYQLNHLADKMNVVNVFALQEGITNNPQFLSPTDQRVFNQAITNLQNVTIQPQISSEIILAQNPRPVRKSQATYHSLTAYWRIDTRDERGELDLNRMEEILLMLNENELVDLAYPELTLSGPADDMSYLGSEGGLNAEELRNALTDIADEFKVNLGDVELGWGNLERGGLATMISAEMKETEKDKDHGTAVLDIILGEDNTHSGMAGSVVKHLYACSPYRCPGNRCSDGNIAQAIRDLILCTWSDTGDVITPPHLNAGDVLLLEVQRDCLPTEISPADMDAIVLAVTRGIIVVEAAGNRSKNLDEYTRSFSTKRVFDEDSGAIIVGAVQNKRVEAAIVDELKKNIDPEKVANVHALHDTSNWGKRIDCYAWGGGVKTSVMESFGGTSAAAAMIAGAALLLQAKHRQVHNDGSSLLPDDMRKLLRTKDFPPLDDGVDIFAPIQVVTGAVPDLGQIVQSITI